MKHVTHPDQSEFWNDWHAKINNRVPNWGTPFPLAEQVLPYLIDKEASPILDLGCGQCNDAIFFAEHGFDVHGVDFSSVALDKARKAIEAKGIKTITLHRRDIAEPLPFENSKFGAVYSHLSLHYFDDATTRSVFSEIHRVLRTDGLFAFSVKSVFDFRHGEGEKIGPDMYNHKGHIRHFFRRDYVEDLLENWKILLFEEYESAYGGSSRPSSFIKVIANK